MYCQFTRLAVLTAAIAIGAFVVPSTLAHDRDERSTSETAHCRELKQRRHQEASGMSLPDVVLRPVQTAQK